MPNTTNGLPYPVNSSANDVPTDLAALANAADPLLVKTRVPTTKGDLVTHNGTSKTRLGVGANGLLLKPLASAATGLTWAAQTGTTGWYQIGWATLASAQASVTLSSIPSTYRALELFCSVRGDTAATTTTMLIRPNNNTSGYYTVRYQTDGTTITVAETAADTAIPAGLIPANTATAGRYAYVQASFGIYRGASYWSTYGTASQQVHVQTRSANYASTTNFHMGGGSCAAGTNVNSVTVLPLAGNFAAGSTFALYGIL